MQTGTKNIVIIGPAYPLRGGLASFNERLAREFIATGFQVSVYTFSLQYPSFLFPGTTQFSTEPPPAGIIINRVINSINPLNWLAVGNRLKKIKPDVVIVRYWLPFMGPCLGTILRLIKLNRHSKVICIADNILPHEKRPGDKIFTKYFIKPVDAFITMSERVMNDLVPLKGQRPAIHVAHPLYDNFGEPVSTSVAREKLGINQSYNLLLFFGFIRRYKGLDILLEAIKILKDEGKLNRPPNHEIKLMIAGEFYEDRSMYDEQIKQAGLAENIILRTEFIPDSEVKYYLCSADLVVQPYRNATQSGVTPLAYHYEIPMLVTNVGGLTVMVPDKKVGLIAEPNAPDIAEKIIEFFSIGKSHFIPYLKEEKQQYSWKKMVEAVLGLAQGKI